MMVSPDKIELADSLSWDGHKLLAEAPLDINIQNRVHPAYPVFWWEVTRGFGGSEDLQRASALHLLQLITKSIQIDFGQGRPRVGQG